MVDTGDKQCLQKKNTQYDIATRIIQPVHLYTTVNKRLLLWPGPAKCSICQAYFFDAQLTEHSALPSSQGWPFLLHYRKGIRLLISRR